VNERLVYRFALILGLAGTIVAGAMFGFHGGLGFAAGSAFSVMNYRAMHRVISTIGTPEAAGAKGAAVFFALRYLLLLGAGYVIVRVSETSLFAAISGLFVSIAAVILASLYELLYART
jgi:hypothetical protein